MTSAKVIADSVSANGDRLTSIEVRLHRFVLAELNTHRVFSRNSASSRAIPLKKQLERIDASPAYPISWPAEQKGMQGGEEFAQAERDRAVEWWDEAADDAVRTARYLGNLGLHKSVVNRLLEPFMWHTVLITATAWQNFFLLRLDPAAQPEMRVAAEKIKAAYDSSEPRLLRSWEPHLPYARPEDIDELGGWDESPETLLLLMKISAARCARLSYLTQDGTRSIQADIELYDRLVSAKHSSPLEHVATPAPDNAHWVDVGTEEKPHLVLLPKYGNLLGWRQHRFDAEAAIGYGAFS